ncbi:hypothetical protein BDZ94DRAFT_1276250 [Collybia nuda]|uniref:Uncharacterized protein n=1 Tax=Collybia nuda TaxID=64659 RepID=A0A9P6C8G8_9AGAR|nr:hypothetical protein BDZ94DRAFT_1276250 [Collybia nuda]
MWRIHHLNSNPDIPDPIRPTLPSPDLHKQQDLLGMYNTPYWLSNTMSRRYSDHPKLRTPYHGTQDHTNHLYRLKVLFWMQMDIPQAHHRPAILALIHRIRGCLKCKYLDRLVRAPLQKWVILHIQLKHCTLHQADRAPTSLSGRRLLIRYRAPK